VSVAAGWHARASRLAIVLLVIVACSREQSPGADTARAPVSSSASAPPTRSDSLAGKTATSNGPAAAAGVVAINSSCVNEGAWHPCSVERRLIDAGFVLVSKGAAPTGVFPVAGTSYTLGTAALHVYLFASSKARETAVAAIDTVTVAPRGGVANWPMPPTLITSNNLAAVLISDNGRLVERVQNAITAGLPSAAH
jgi:hypothetical protein